MTNFCLRPKTGMTQLTLAINIRQGKWTTPAQGHMNSNIIQNTDKVQSRTQAESIKQNECPQH